MKSRNGSEIFQYLAFAAFALVALYYVGPLLWGLIPQSKNPFPELEADNFVAEYAKDAAAANEKFADKVVVIRGKLKVVRSRHKGSRTEPPARVYFEIPDQGKLSVECVFDDVDVAFDLKEDAEYRIVGKVQRFKPGTPITIKPATVKAGQQTAALPRSGKDEFANLHQFLTPRSSSLDIADLQSRSIARAIAAIRVGRCFPSRSYA